MAHVENTLTTNNLVVTRRLDAVVWGLFFVWVGVALILGLSWGFSVLVVGFITLGGQLARRFFGLTFEGFWVLVGFVLVIGGAWELLSVRLSLVPILLIVAGGVLLISAMGRQRA